jgi:hypothetical protein
MEIVISTTKIRISWTYEKQRRKGKNNGFGYPLINEWISVERIWNQQGWAKSKVNNRLEKSRNGWKNWRS